MYHLGYRVFAGQHHDQPVNAQRHTGARRGIGEVYELCVIRMMHASPFLLPSCRLQVAAQSSQVALLGKAVGDVGRHLTYESPSKGRGFGTTTHGLSRTVSPSEIRFLKENIPKHWKWEILI